MNRLYGGFFLDKTVQTREVYGMLLINTVSETSSIDNGFRAGATCSLILSTRSCLQPASCAASFGDRGKGHEPFRLDRFFLPPFRCSPPARLISQKFTCAWVGQLVNLNSGG